MTPRRPVVLLAVAAFLAGAVALERDREAPAVGDGAVRLERLAPTVEADGALSSTWFCAAGTSLGAEGAAEQLVVIENAGSDTVEATLTAYGDEGQQGVEAVELPPASRTQVAVSSIVDASWAGVLVESPAGEIAVQHLLSGNGMRTAGPCASSVAPTWYLPVGTTVLGVEHRLVLFNPFPDEAVVDLTFETETDTRRPSAYQALVVAGRSVKVLDVSSEVTVREQMATTVVARSGLVVAEQLAIVAADSDLPPGMAVLLGAPAAVTSWAIPDGPALREGDDVHVVVFNPGGQQAEVDVSLLVADPSAVGVVEPYELSVRPGQFEVIDLRADQRLPDGVGWSAVVQSRNGQPVVAARAERRAAREGVGPAELTVLGSPVGATRWDVPLGNLSSSGPARVVVANPAVAEPVSVSVSAIGDGTVEPVGAADELRVGPGARVVIDLGRLDASTAWSLRVEADRAVVVEASVAFADDGGLAAWIGLPSRPTLSLLPDAVADVAVSPTVVLDGSPIGTAPLGTAPVGAAPTGTTPSGTTPAGTTPPGNAPAPEDGSSSTTAAVDG